MSKCIRHFCMSQDVSEVMEFVDYLFTISKKRRLSSRRLLWLEAFIACRIARGMDEWSRLGLVSMFNSLAVGCSRFRSAYRLYDGVKR